MFKKIIISVLSLSAIANCSAIYLELNGGYSNAESNTLNVNNVDLNSQKNKHWGGNINLGEQFLGLIGVEAGYTDYGDLTWTNGNTSTNSRLSSYQLAAVFQHSVGPAYIQTKLGVGRLSRDSFDLGAVKVAKTQNTNLYWSSGGGLNLPENWYSILQFQRLHGSNGNPTVNLTSLGLGYRF